MAWRTTGLVYSVGPGASLPGQGRTAPAPPGETTEGGTLTLWHYESANGA